MTLAAPTLGIPPVRPQVSLLTAARRLPDGTDWRSGLRYRQTNCPTVGRWPLCPGPTDEKDEGGCQDEATFFPFGIYVPAEADWVLEEREPEHSGELRAQIDAATPFQIARELWTGETNTGNEANPSLQSPVPGSPFEPTHIITGPLNPVDAIGALLAAYGDGTGHGGGAVLHIPMRLIPTLLQNGTITREGSTYRVGDALVSPGPGYPHGAGDFGPRTTLDPGGLNTLVSQVFMFVSGPVEYEVGEIRVLPEEVARWFDRRTNRWVAVAERQAIYRFDPCSVYAVLVTLPTAA